MHEAKETMKGVAPELKALSKVYLFLVLHICNTAFCNNEIIKNEVHTMNTEDIRKAISKRKHELKMQKAKADRHAFESVDLRAQKLGVRSGALIEFCIRNSVLISQDKKTGQIRIDKTALDEALKNPVMVNGLSKLGRSYDDHSSIEVLKAEVFIR